MRVVIVAISIQIADERSDSIIRGQVGRELPAVSAVEEDELVPWAVNVLFDLRDRSVMRSSHLNELLAEPLTILARHRVFILAAHEEGYSIIFRACRRINKCEHG